MFQKLRLNLHGMQTARKGEVISAPWGMRPTSQEGAQGAQQRHPGGRCAEPGGDAWCLRPTSPPDGPQLPQTQRPSLDTILILFSMPPLKVDSHPSQKPVLLDSLSCPHPSRPVTKSHRLSNYVFLKSLFAFHSHLLPPL